MHPIIQMTIAVMMVVIATRMWPPLLYWLVGIVAALMVVKCARRLTAWFRCAFREKRINAVIYGSCIAAFWLIIAGIVDGIHPQKISAVSIVTCFICASVVIAVVISLAGTVNRYLHRR